MAAAIEPRIRRAASTASHIASLCQLLAQALGSDPETSIAGEAVEGVGELAISLSNHLHEIAEEAA
jgi:hypothetical protein